MKKRYKLFFKLVPIVILIILILGVLVIKYNSVIIPYIMQSEKIGKYEMTKMNECKNSNNVFFLLKDGTNIPLPDGAVEFKNEVYDNENQYLVNLDNVKLYFEDASINQSFSLEQQGSIIYVYKDDNLKVTINVYMYTKNFMRWVIMEN